MFAALAAIAAGTALDAALPAQSAAAATIGGAQLPFHTTAIYRHWGKRELVDNTEHRGTDFSYAPARAGAAVVAAAAGTVTDVSYSNAHGYFVIINHGNDSEGYRWWTRYHMINQAGRPAIGATVTQGQQIGTIAAYHSDGRYWTGPHLHFEVNTSNTSLHTPGYLESVNPVDYIHRVPTAGSSASPEPEPEENEMIIYAKAGDAVGIFGGGWSYTFQNPEELSLFQAMVRNSGHTLPPRLEIAVRAYNVLERASKGNA